MKTEPGDAIDVCKGCGDPLDVLNERYAYGGHSVLCWNCAVERGGIYDGEHECWVNEPDVQDVPPSYASPIG